MAQNRFRHFAFRSDTSGNIAIITALAASVLAGTAGIALLMGQNVRQKTALQAALDAGVLAGTSLAYGVAPEKRVKTAEQAFYANAKSGTFNDGGVEFSADQLLKPAFTVSKSHVSGTATAVVKNTLAASFGITSMNVNSSARAEKQLSEPVCVLSLNRTAASSIYVYGNADLDVKDCAIQANSTSSQALQMDGKTSEVTAKQIGVTGGYGGNSNNWTPDPITGSEPIEDPYAALPVPEPENCVNLGGKLQSNSFSLGPGTYCGGISIKSGARVTLDPGIYIIKDGQLAIDSGAMVTGDKVMFAFVGANAYLNMKSDAAMTITSPTSGTYKNIQMMSDGDLSDSKFGEEWCTILSGAKLDYDGVLYLPEQQFWVSGTAQDAVVKGSSPSMVLVVDKVWAQGNAVIDLRRDDKRKTGGDGIVANFGYGARLVR